MIVDIANASINNTDATVKVQCSVDEQQEDVDLRHLRVAQHAR